MTLVKLAHQPKTSQLSTPKAIGPTEKIQRQEKEAATTAKKNQKGVRRAERKGIKSMDILLKARATIGTEMFF